MYPSDEIGAFLEQMHEEHNELRDLLGRTEKLLSTRRGRPDEAASLVEATCKHVQSHFHTEEQEGGFFDQIIDDAPRYHQRIATLRQDHVDLSNRAALLIARANEKSGSDRWWIDLKAEFHAFCKALMHHESCENDLLQETYAEDIGAQD